jgi:hypothetical protein
LSLSPLLKSRGERASSLSLYRLERKRVFSLWEGGSSSATEGGPATRLPEPRGGSLPLSLRQRRSSLSEASISFVRKRASCLSLSLSLSLGEKGSSFYERESSSTTEGGPATRQANEEHHIARGIQQLHVRSCAVLRLTFEDHLRKLEAA